MSDKNNVIVAKTELMNSLGVHAPKYLDNLKLWFRQKYTKEEFDKECRKILTSDQISLHNRFLVAILNKIDAFTPQPQISSQPQQQQSTTTATTSNSGNTTNDSLNSKKRRKTTRPPSEWATFEPVEISDYLTHGEGSAETNINNNTNPVRYAAQELFLPDAGLVMGRLLVGAWEVGLVNVDDSACEIIAQAVQVLLKNILSSIILKKKQAKYTADSKFYYDVGYRLKNPFLRTTIGKQKIDDEPVDINKVISTVSANQRTFEENIFTTNCEEIETPSTKNISVLDVYKTLMDRNIIPSHSVYSLNIERISNMLN